MSIDIFFYFYMLVMNDRLKRAHMSTTTVLYLYKMKTMPYIHQNNVPPILFCKA